MVGVWPELLWTQRLGFSAVETCCGLDFCLLTRTWTRVLWTHFINYWGNLPWTIWILLFPVPRTWTRNLEAQDQWILWKLQLFLCVFFSVERVVDVSSATFCCLCVGKSLLYTFPPLRAAVCLTDLGTPFAWPINMTLRGWSALIWAGGALEAVWTV